MNWGLTIVIALLTGIAGASAAGCIGEFCVDWYRISSREGGSGYFVISLGLVGLLVGLVIGAVTSRVVQSGFWVAQGYALAIVVGVGLGIGLVARFFGEVAPTLDGDTVMLQAELKCPRGWKPDNKTKSQHGSNCWLETINTTSSSRGPSISGSVDWKQAKLVDEQWIATCEVSLFTGRKDRYVRVVLGKAADVSFLLTMPGTPRAGHQQWSDWSNKYFSHEVGKPPVTDYQFRYRVKRDSEWRNERERAEAAARAARVAAVAAAVADAPISVLLPLFEQPDGNGLPTADLLAGVEEGVRGAVKARAGELAPLLGSVDLQIARRAVYAAATMDAVPAELIEPLAKAGGRVTLELIRLARAGAVRPDDPDLDAENRASTFFFKWGMAMTNAGEAAKGERVKVLRVIAKELAGDTTGDLATIRSYAEQDIKSLTE